MEQIKSKKISLLPWVYRQFISKRKYRGLTLLACLLEMRQLLTFYKHAPNRNQPFYMFDHLIVGSNMIINLIILNSILDNIKNTNVANIGVFLPKELDYWSYDLLNESSFLEEFKKIPYLTNKKNIDEILKELIERLNSKKMNIIFLDERFRINYVEYDNFTKTSFFWFDNKKNNIVKNEANIETNNEIKNFMNKEVLKVFEKNENTYKLIWDFHSTYIKDSNYETNNCALSISKNTHISSLPQGWLNLNNKISQQRVDYENDKYILYGTAKTVYLEKKSLKEQYFNDFKELLSSLKNG